MPQAVKQPMGLEQVSREDWGGVVSNFTLVGWHCMQNDYMVVTVHHNYGFICIEAPVCKTVSRYFPNSVGRTLEMTLGICLLNDSMIIQAEPLI